MSNLIIVDYPASTDDYVCPAQTFTADQPLIFSYQINNAYQFRFDAHQRVITFTSASNISGVSFDIVGKDVYGNTLGETVTGVNGNTVESTLQFSLITSITPDSNASNPAFTVSVGMTDVGATQWIPLDANRKIFQTTLQSVVTNPSVVADVDYSVNMTLDPIQTYANGEVIFNTDDTDYFAFPLSPTLTYDNGGAAVGELYYLTSPATAVLVGVTDLSGGSFKFTILQQGE
jgi:hypothetical protein